MKPHKGRISNWAFKTAPQKEVQALQKEFPDATHEYVVGNFVDHPEFHGKWGWTSMLVSQQLKEDGSIEIETLNSRYTLLPNTTTRDKADLLSL